MRLTVTTFLSLDGTMQGPGGPDEDRSGGFELGGWMAPMFDDDLAAAMSAWPKADAYLLGRRTYELFAGYWPNVTDPGDEMAASLNSRPKYVASRTLRTVDWAGAEILQGDVADAVRALKDRPGGELQVHGSGALVQTLLEHGLVDELRLMTFPVLLGSGRRLFAEGTRPGALRLRSTQSTRAGAVISVYEATGAAPGQASFGIVDGRDVLVDGGGGPAAA
ncbi:MAG TPA: dihydrofolate reductase family protein [Capillimicrobium sp.]